MADSGFVLRATVYAIKQTDRETGKHTYRDFRDDDGPQYPALFTSKIKADAYVRTLRSLFKDDYAFSVVTVRTMDLLSLGDLPPVLEHDDVHDRPDAYGPVTEGTLG